MNIFSNTYIQQLVTKTAFYCTLDVKSCQILSNFKQKCHDLTRKPHSSSLHVTSHNSRNLYKM